MPSKARSLVCTAMNPSKLFYSEIKRSIFYFRSLLSNLEGTQLDKGIIQNVLYDLFANRDKNNQTKIEVQFFYTCDG